MRYLSVVAIFRSENSWLEEWIRYHKAVGVEHFYLYNDDEDSTVSDKILSPHVSSGFVDNIHISSTASISSIGRRWQQQASYRNAIKMATTETKFTTMRYR